MSTIIGSRGEEIIRKSVTIGDNVGIGSNTMNVHGVIIGYDVTIGAVITEDVPPNSVVVGVPARVMK